MYIATYNKPLQLITLFHATVYIQCVDPASLVNEVWSRAY